MAIEFEIHGSLVHARANVTGTAEQLVDAVQRATRDPEFRTGSVVVVDVRGIAEAPKTTELATTGRLLANLGSGHFSRMAFVAEGPLQFGLTRLFGAHVDAAGLEVQVFENEADALSWLGIG